MLPRWVARSVKPWPPESSPLSRGQRTSSIRLRFSQNFEYTTQISGSWIFIGEHFWEDCEPSQFRDFGAKPLIIERKVPDDICGGFGVDLRLGGAKGRRWTPPPVSSYRKCDVIRLLGRFGDVRFRCIGHLVHDRWLSQVIVGDVLVQSCTRFLS